MAIIDYLKRYHPQDNETFDMVAHNFMMHREIAQLLQSRAQHILETFREMNIGRGHQSQSTDSTNGQLEWQTICRSSVFLKRQIFKVFSNCCGIMFISQCYSVDSSPETQTNLQSVVQLYMDAAESYCKVLIISHWISLFR